MKKCFQYLAMTLIFILVLNAQGFPGDAEEKPCDARGLSYDMMCEIFQIASRDLPRGIHWGWRVSSNIATIKIQDIQVAIEWGKSSSEIDIDKNGFLKLTVNKELLGKGACLVHNQPKGALKLSLWIQEKVPSENRSIRYRDLISPLMVTRSAMEILRKEKVEKDILNFVEDLKLFLIRSSEKPVIISGNAEDRIEIKPDANGIVTIPALPQLLERNPLITFPCDRVLYK